MMERSIGGLWLKEKGDLKYYTGEIVIDGKKIRIAVFKNKFKKDKQPDLKIYESKAKGVPSEPDKAFL